MLFFIWMGQCLLNDHGSNEKEYEDKGKEDSLEGTESLDDERKDETEADVARNEVCSCRQSGDMPASVQVWSEDNGLLQEIKEGQQISGIPHCYCCGLSHVSVRNTV